MADRDFSSLVPRLAPSVPGCPQATLVQYIRDSAIRACERTLAWRYEEPTFNLLPGVHKYAYNKPVNTDVHVLFAAIVNNSPLDHTTLEEALRRYPMWADLYSGEDPSVVWSLTPPGSFNAFDYNENLFNEGSPYVLPQEIIDEAGTPTLITQVTPDQYVVLPLPDDTPYKMRMFYALKPKRSATGMNEVAFDDLEDVIMHGALQHLLVLPQVHWSDRELASYHAKQYLFHISERRARANLGNSRAPMSVRMRPFA